MIDLTEWIMRSLHIRKNGFSQNGWIEAWKSFVNEEPETKFAWMEEDDIWFEIGYSNQEKLAFSVGRDMPLVFYGDKDQLLLEKFRREYYQQDCMLIGRRLGGKIVFR